MLQSTETCITRGGEFVASIGLAQAPDSASLFELIGLADTRLYRSKQAGRDQVNACQLA